MDNIRNIISNLYIYKLQNNDNLNINKFIIKSKIDESLSKEEFKEKSIQDINSSQIKNNKNLYEIIKINNKSKNQRIDNYNKKYISLKNNNFLKNEVNYVMKNKELLREQEIIMKELKLKKENDALNLLLSYKSKKNNGVRSKLFDYEIKQRQNKINLLKKNKSKSKFRNYSSKRPLSYIKNNYYKNNNENEYEYEYDQINEYRNNIKISFAKSVKLPRIHIKPSSSQKLEGLPILHQDLGKMPKYLEKMKKEIKEDKQKRIIKQKEKNLPSGFRILSEDERIERLDNLKKEKIKLEEEICKLPIARITEKQKKVKAQIEKSLDEIDEKINKLIGYKEVIVKE